MKRRILACILLTLAAALTVGCGPSAPAAETGGGFPGDGIAVASQLPPEHPAAKGSSVTGITTSNTLGQSAVYPGQTAVNSSDETRRDQAGTISVTGQGQVSAAPDLATLRLGTEAIADTVQEARTTSSAATQGMIDALLELEVAEEDIGTSSIKISTVFDYENQTVTGYRVSNRLTVRLRDLSSVGTVIDRVTEAGGDLTRLQGVTFAIEDTDALEEQARAAAVADLSDKAEQLAELLGVEVGPAISIVEGGGEFQPLRESFGLSPAAAYSDSQSTPVLAGDVQVTVTVHAVFEIAEPEQEGTQ